MAGNIFINYRRDESGHVAGRLHDSLAPTFGRNKLFMDVDNIPVGRDFEDYLKSQVAACDAMLAVIGPNWLTAKDETGKRRLDNPDDFIVIEIGAALGWDRDEACQRWAAEVGPPNDPISGDGFRNAVRALAVAAGRDPDEAVGWCGNTSSHVRPSTTHRSPRRRSRSSS